MVRDEVVVWLCSCQYHVICGARGVVTISPSLSLPLCSSAPLATMKGFSLDTQWVVLVRWSVHLPFLSFFPLSYGAHTHARAHTHTNAYTRTNTQTQTNTRTHTWSAGYATMWASARPNIHRFSTQLVYPAKRGGASRFYKLHGIHGILPIATPPAGDTRENRSQQNALLYTRRRRKHAAGWIINCSTAVINGERINSAEAKW